ncbi:hypothetical protein ACFFGH_25630 [Lysobacter korlensis]|uniref:DUF1330 domain-containing protein n=1 Tax=Lysobacter korlensis TaxID=553636 RepID=A0ABV6RW59_9GAMM
MALTLHVRLWAVPGREEQLIEYEDAVLAMLPRHGGRVLGRMRTETVADAPLEIQIIEIRDFQSLQNYLRDPGRQALSWLRDTAIARSEMLEVTRVL